MPLERLLFYDSVAVVRTAGHQSSEILRLEMIILAANVISSHYDRHKSKVNRHEQKF